MTNQSEINRLKADFSIDKIKLKFDANKTEYLKNKYMEYLKLAMERHADEPDYQYIEFTEFLELAINLGTSEIVSRFRSSQNA